MILIDTGFIVAAAIEDDEHHKRCAIELSKLIAKKETLLLPATVTAEVGYMLYHEGGTSAEITFLESVASGELQPVELLTEDYARMAVLAKKYSSFPLGTTDASVIAIAERLDISTIATVDRRHFTVVRPKHQKAFNLLPEVL
ncbi:MAG: PIN domain-containing protein [Promicromonosporaceae bacterium]|nr:PIN domain-containing protein [Promicromonosporaceae bacterium]